MTPAKAVFLLAGYWHFARVSLKPDPASGPPDQYIKTGSVN